jgi:outer membrane receptor for ferrienterochelin and colicin
VRSLIATPTLALTLLVALPAHAEAAPPVPEGALEGEIVEVDGELYEVRDGALEKFDDGLGEEPEADPSPSEAPAADAPQPQEIEVTASRVDRGERSSVKTETIESDAIAQTGARNLADVLERAPGFNVTDSIGTGQEVSLDGFDAKHVLILIDGKPVNGRIKQRVDVSRLPISPSDVERVEVVRGPMSALYGSEALGGVVNIITKRPTHGVSGAVEASTRLTRYGAQRNGMSGSGSFNIGDLLLKGNGSLTLDRGIDRGARDDPTGFVELRPDGRFDLPHRRQGTLGGEAGYFLGDFYLRGWANGSYSEVETRAFRGSVPRDHSTDAQGRAGLGVDGDLPFGLRASADVRYDRFFHSNDKLPSGEAIDPPPFCEDKDLSGVRVIDPACPATPNRRSETTWDEIRLDANVSQETSDEVFGFALPGWAGELGWSAGTAQQVLLAQRLGCPPGELCPLGDFTDLAEDSLSDNGVQYTGSLFAEVLWRPFAWLTLVPGARGDLLAGDLTAVNVGPKLSTRVELPWDLALRASYGRGFRAPGFLERGLCFEHPDGGYAVEGNPDLVPEVNDGARAELIWSASDKVTISGELFGNVANNLILETQGAPGELCPNTDLQPWTYKNVATAFMSGMNLRLTTARLNNFSFTLSYTYQLAALDTSGCPDDNPFFCGEEEGAEWLPNRPRHMGNLAVRYRLAATDTDVFTRVDFKDERPLVGGTTAAGYVRLGVGLTQPVLDHLSFTFTLDNLLDAYGPVHGPKPGRHATVAIRGQL